MDDGGIYCIAVNHPVYGRFGILVGAVPVDVEQQGWLMAKVRRKYQGPRTYDILRAV